MDTFPLYSFFGSLGIKYIAGIMILATIFAFTAEFFGPDITISPQIVIFNTLLFSAMLLLAAFIIYIVYKIIVGNHFQFLPLMISASILFFLSSLTIAVVSDRSGFHILHVLLALLASLTIAAIFSAFIIVAQRFIST